MIKVALIQDWLTELGGAEKVFSAIYELYPNADIYTLVYNTDLLEKIGIPEEKVTASFIQKLPFAKKKYRNYLPLFSKAIESFDLSSYDLIISSSSCVAKGVLTHAGQTHICYCHSPVRYGWDLYFQYLTESKLIGYSPKALLAKSILHKLRIWDIISSNRVDHFISNSNYIQKRIYKTYRREAKTIYPPVAVKSFDHTISKEDFYFTCSRMVPYKKIDIIVEAFSKMPDKKLIVIGNGPDKQKIEKLRTSNIELMGYQPFSVLKEHMERAKAFVFAAEEDFGIVPVEAQACGTPVIAFGKGGSLETIKDKETGIFFYEQTANAIIEAVNNFEEIKASFDPQLIREHALNFDIDIFKENIKNYMTNIMNNKSI
ncbi:Glycosyl transferase, group 1 [uncultured Dysgonomonas sp.]|uniref:Glycosyl transferase, group 1 n=1 Tax=uncultured Dysgonomonas sp. TaxID=206096 RepID=A0A212K8J6_9BACT|nr:glycosyltransferase family 4 protein [uncultured Dysgonomonas sp.]SBW08023.1 Glycosyl transferase, group 1 [uncultured Dysgonomonas sp.]